MNRMVLSASPFLKTKIAGNPSHRNGSEAKPQLHPACLLQSIASCSYLLNTTPRGITAGCAGCGNRLTAESPLLLGGIPNPNYETDCCTDSIRKQRRWHPTHSSRALCQRYTHPRRLHGKHGLQQFKALRKLDAKGQPHTCPYALTPVDALTNCGDGYSGMDRALV